MAESPWSRRPVLPRATSFTRAGSRLRATACVSGAGVEPALPRISAWCLLPLGYSDVAPLSDRAGLTAWRGPAHDGASSAVRGPGAGTRRPRFTEPPPGVEPDLRPDGGRAENRRLARQRAQEKVIEYLREHPCVDCGETDIVVLEFDHQGDKAEEVNLMVRAGAPWRRILAEIMKCEVVCANDHRRRTAKAFGYYRARAV